jgi:hypothetical protein
MKSPKPFLMYAALGLLSAGALASLLWLGAGRLRGDRPAPAGSAAAATAPAPLSPPAATPGDPLHGGRTAAWWEERLSLLRRRTDPEGVALYAATRARAEANGFEVTEQGDAVKLAERAAGARDRGSP